MSDFLKQTQEAGELSTAMQAGRDINITGITMTEARQIALDVFKANALELAGIARELFEARAQKFIERYLEDLQRRKSGALDSFRDPDTLYALFTAQRDYARTGREELEQGLVDLLAERATTTNLRRIVLNEAISKAAVLTSTQLDALSALLLLKYPSPLRFRFTTLKDFNEYLHRYISPLFHTDTAEATTWAHMLYAGCVSSLPNHGPLSFLFLIRNAFQTCFAEGCPRSEIELSCSKLKDLFVPSFYSDSAIQITMDRRSFVQICHERGLSEQQNSAIWNLLCKQYLPDTRIAAVLLEADERFTSICQFPYAAPYIHGTLELTSVGMALANANLAHRVGLNLDLGTWIT